ncbi:MAG: histone deacetylase [Treponema sp.]|jgi:acetoin utilization deacetylase AcuC-like enzyme|nr:histone deacetylase [Treponema sp.]
MILYDPALICDLRDYGIMVPVSPSRQDKIAAYLRREGADVPVHTFDSAAALLALPSPAITRTDLERVHSPAYIARLYGDRPEQELLAAYELINPDGSYHRYEPEKALKPLAALFENTLLRVSGAYIAARLALADSAGQLRHFCYYLDGGNHHARYDGPSGFCLLNDLLIAARKLQSEQCASLIWIIDVDAHKGDGSAELAAFSRERRETFRGKNPEIITLSAHMATGWPLDAESLAQAQPGRAPLVPSDIDIPISPGDETRYTALLADGLAKLEQLSGERKPDIALVVDGADVYEKDGLASSAPLALALEQCVERDRLIFAFLQKRRIPSAWVIAGGYGEEAWKPTAWFLDSLRQNPADT